MDIKKFKALMAKAKRKDVKNNEEATAKAEELRCLLDTAGSQIVEIYEYTEGDFRFVYDDVHYSVSLDRIDFNTPPDKIHIHRCVEGNLISWDINMDVITCDTSRDLERLNEVITNWFKAKGVRSNHPPPGLVLGGGCSCYFYIFDN